jgi:hypothetical protein
VEPLSAAVQTAYAELVEQLLALEARRTIGHAPGAIVLKELKGREYYYFQYSVPGGRARQAYLGAPIAGARCGRDSVRARA